MQPQLVCGACRLDPVVAAYLVCTDDVVHALAEDLGAAPRQRPDTGILQLLNRLPDAEL